MNETNGISALRNVVNDAAEPVSESAPDTFGATSAPLDVAFLANQTFADRDLEREVLGLFVAQARRVVPSLPTLPGRKQADAAHLLKGSARGIGAWAAAAIAESYEQASADARVRIHPRLAATFEEVEAAIAAHLDQG